MSLKRLTLHSVVLGCRTPEVYNRLRLALGIDCGDEDGTTSPLSELSEDAFVLANETNSQEQQSETETKSPQIIQNCDYIRQFTANKAAGQRVRIVYGSNLSYEAACGIGFINSKDEEAMLQQVAVLSTSPFSDGYLSHSTEIIIVRIPPKHKIGPKHLRRVTPPVVSDFLTSQKVGTASVNYLASVIDLDETFEERLMQSHPKQDLNSSVIMNSDLARSLGVMSGSQLTCHVPGTTDKFKRQLRVFISDEVRQKTSIVLNSVAWYNLGGHMFEECKRAHIQKYHAPGSTGSSNSQLDTQIKQAAKCTVVPIFQVTDSGDLLSMDAVKQYFSVDRYLQVGDVFTIQMYGKDDKPCKRLMKVLRLDDSDKSQIMYKVNLHTKVYEGVAVHGFILPEICKNRVPISAAFADIREMLVQTLKPFVIHAWRPSPIPLVLMSGPEGSGKAFVINQLAQLLQCNYMQMNCVHLVADTILTTETRIKELLATAQSISPVVLLLRNIHTLTKDEINNMENPRIAQTFQQALEQTLRDSQWPMIVVGTCERLSLVSDGIREMALREISIEAPDVDERFLLLKDMTSSLNLHPTVSLDHLADHTAGCLFGDLRALVGHAHRNSLVRAMKLCQAELGTICEETIAQCNVFITVEDFDLALCIVQAQHAKDLGAPKIPNVKWSDIGGLDDVKEDILDTIQLPLIHPEFFISTMRRSGILFYGPPGTGKTLLAKAVATECSLNFFSVKGPELINMYVGQSEENVRQVFSKARSSAPCVIFFDELDSLAPNRGRSGDSGGVMDRVVSQLLAELDGLHKSADVFVIGATNRPDLLDPALLRPGRFDKLVYIGISNDPAHQLTILQAITRKFDLDPDCDLARICDNLPPSLTGADLYSLCTEAMTNAIKRQIDLIEGTGKNIEECKLVVCQQDFLSAINQLTPSLSLEEIERYEKVRQQFNQRGRQGQSDSEISEALRRIGDSIS